MKLNRRVERYWHTIRYLRAEQIAARLSLRAHATARNLSPTMARRLYAIRAAGAGLTYAKDPWHMRGLTSRATDLMAPETLAVLERDAADVSIGTFTFLNERLELGRPVDWMATSASQLWRYHLHYFDYLPDLLLAGAASAGVALMSDWTTRVPLAHAATRDAWHPYVVSLRIVNWMLFAAAAPPDVQLPGPVIESLRIQTVFVRENLETDVGGNHLLKNLKALAIAGTFWQGDEARKLRDRFTNRFVRELGRQLRSDGGHYEQSPMYHAQVLGDAIELALVLRLTGIKSNELHALIQRMEGFLTGVCHPDGRPAQFGDTADGMTPEPRALLAAGSILRGHEPQRVLVARHALLSSTLEGHDRHDAAHRSAAAGTAEAVNEVTDWDPNASGFVTLSTADQRGFLIADAGPVCPDDLPAHAHSDLFGFEVSVDSTRLVVDSGVSEYAAGAWRDYYRSTRAHSTVVVDGTEQSDCWGSFRVARRARVVNGRFEATASARGFAADHTGFILLPSPVTHRRRFLLVAERFWIIIDDLLGGGVHQWQSFLHLHPEVELRSEDGARLVARRGAAALGIAWFGIETPRCVKGEREPLQGWYAPAFGRVLPSPTLIAAGSGQLPVRFGWLLLPNPEANETFGVDRIDVDRIIVSGARQRYEIGVERLP